MTLASTFLRKARTAASLGLRRQALLVEAVAALSSARWHLRFRPFRDVASRLGEMVSTADVDMPPTTHDASDVAREIGWAIGVVAPLMPFRVLCLEQAIAGQVLLRRRGIANILYLGVELPAGAPMAAHAWLSAAGVRVTGFPLSPGMKPICRFVCGG